MFYNVSHFLKTLLLATINPIPYKGCIKLRYPKTWKITI